MQIDKGKEVIISIVLLVIFLGIGGIILTELIPTLQSSNTVNNQTLTSMTAGSAYSLVYGNPDFPAGLSVAFLTNETSGVIYTQNSSNFYVNSTYGTITLLSTITGETVIIADVVATTGFNVSYSYNTGNTATSVITNGTLTMQNFSKQLPTVGIVLGITLIIGAVVMIAVYFKKKEYF